MSQSEDDRADDDYRRDRLAHGPCDPYPPRKSSFKKMDPNIAGSPAAQEAEACKQEVATARSAFAEKLRKVLDDAFLYQRRGTFDAHEWTKDRDKIIDRLMGETTPGMPHERDLLVNYTTGYRCGVRREAIPNITDSPKAKHHTEYGWHEATREMEPALRDAFENGWKARERMGGHPARGGTAEQFERWLKSGPQYFETPQMVEACSKCRTVAPYLRRSADGKEAYCERCCPWNVDNIREAAVAAAPASAVPGDDVPIPVSTVHDEVLMDSEQAKKVITEDMRRVEAAFRDAPPISVDAGDQGYGGSAKGNAWVSGPDFYDGYRTTVRGGPNQSDDEPVRGATYARGREQALEDMKVGAARREWKNSLICYYHGDGTVAAERRPHLAIHAADDARRAMLVEFAEAGAGKDMIVLSLSAARMDIGWIPRPARGGPSPEEQKDAKQAREEWADAVGPKAVSASDYARTEPSKPAEEWRRAAYGWKARAKDSEMNLTAGARAMLRMDLAIKASTPSDAISSHDKGAVLEMLKRLQVEEVMRVTRLEMEECFRVRKHGGQPRDVLA